MNTTITLHLRRKYGERGTNGTIYFLGEPICHTIELPWQDNTPNESCIPEGRYKLEKRVYPENGEQIGIPSVQGREAILVLGGSCCGIVGLIPWHNLLQTVILAIVGTLVSYLLTRILQRKRK